MYYSYLRGKQYELLAIRASMPKMVEKAMSAIVEPVRESTRDLFSCLKDAYQHKARIILITNPKCGELKNNERELELIINKSLEINPNVELAFIVDDKTSANQLSFFFNAHPQQNKSIIHYGRYADVNELLRLQSIFNLFLDNIFIDGKCSANYIGTFDETRKVLIKDGFTRAATNAAYSTNLVEFFSDLHKNFKALGYRGFGDFSIVGDHFSEGGGQAITAAIHITYKELDGPDLLIHHFLSDPRAQAEDVAIIVDEALEKLKGFVEVKRPDILKWSTSCKEFIRIYNDPNGKTNLAYIKKLTIKHHFELMHYIL